MHGATRTKVGSERIMVLVTSASLLPVDTPITSGCTPTLISIYLPTKLTKSLSAQYDLISHTGCCIIKGGYPKGDGWPLQKDAWDVYKASSFPECLLKICWWHSAAQCCVQGRYWIKENFSWQSYCGKNIGQVAVLLPMTALCVNPQNPLESSSF